MTERGCERTEKYKECAALFEASGLKLLRFHPTKGPLSLVEAAKS
jgi:hypothetical protein